MRTIIVIITILILVMPGKAQGPLSTGEEEQATDVKVTKTERMNFFIVSKRKKGKLDLATRFNTLRTQLRGLSHKHSFIAIIASDLKDLEKKVRFKLEEKKAVIGTIWFDSHGAYKKGYSLFNVGKDECNARTLADSTLADPLLELGKYSDPLTKVVIGSCYGGATYCRPSVDYKDTMCMDGSSLMMAVGRIFKNATVYGSESWVMSKPGLFHRKPAAGGNPGRKLFRDLCYRPAWEHVGIWNEYNSLTQAFGRSNTVALDRSGNLVIRGKPYQEEKNRKKDLEKILVKLKPGLYK